MTNGHFELAARLLDAGADPNAAHPGYTPLHMLARVRKPGAGDNNPRPDGSGSMDGLDFVRDMVAHGADVEARMTVKARLNNTSLNELGASPFVLAALVADADLMRMLAELGADPLTRTDDDSTALMAAAGLPALSGLLLRLIAAVLGANDGLVSNFSLVMGVAGGTGNLDFVLLAGTAGPDSEPGPHGGGGDPVHALLPGSHGVRAVPQRADDRAANGAHPCPRQRCANCPVAS